MLFVVLGIAAVGLIISVIAFVMFKQMKKRREGSKYNAAAAASSPVDKLPPTYVVSLQRRDEEKVITSTCEIPFRESFRMKNHENNTGQQQRETIIEDTYCEITQSVFNCGSNGTEGVYAFTRVKAGALPQEENSTKVMI